MQPSEPPPDDNPYASPASPSAASRAEAVPSGQPLPHGAVPAYGLEAFIFLVLCLSPLSLVAIYFSGRVNYKLSQGDLSGARQASRMAKRLCWLSFLLYAAGAILIVGGMLLFKALSQQPGG